jgi:two-component sensor histidine kinase/putative methionine-R-sulfoxide reductase with GAF domain
MTDPALAPSQPGADPLAERLRRYLGILSDFSRIAAESADLDRLLQLACVQAARGIGIGHTKVMRYRAQEGDLLVEAGVGWKPGVVGQTTLGTDIASPSGRALQSRQPIVVDDLPGSGEFRYSTMLREHGIVSLLNVPVVADGTVWGVLEVDSAQPRHFGEDDVTFLLTMATILGTAVQHRRAAQQAVEAAAQAALALSEQQVLLREQRHRDKNDFQLIVSLLMLQMRQQQDPEARRGFRHVMDRVAAISMAHDQLAAREGSIDLGDYLRALCGNLDQRREGVRIEADLDSTVIAHGHAVALGLIVNELVTNALKHAFPGDRQGTVRVTFRAKNEASEGHLCVADDGVGMGAPRPGGGSGLELVQALMRKVGGRITTASSEQGTKFRVDFLLVR